jgi:uncharacterized protein
MGLRRDTEDRETSLYPLTCQLDTQTLMSCPLDGAARTTEEPPAHVAGPHRTVLGLEPRFLAIGVAGGVLSGLLGVGGGIVMVPLLVLWAAYGQRDAHALSLGAIIPISLASVITYGAAGKVHYGEAIALAVGAVAGARIGAGALARIDERWLKLVFGVFLAAVGVLMLVRS